MPLFKYATRAGQIERKNGPLIAERLGQFYGNETAKDFAEKLNMDPKAFRDRVGEILIVRVDWVLSWSAMFSSDNAVMRKLLGASESKSEKPKKKRLYTEKLKSLLQVHNVNMKKASLNFGFSNNHLHTTVNGERTMAVFELVAISEILNMPIEDLIDELF